MTPAASQVRTPKSTGVGRDVGKPMRVSIADDQLEVSAVLSDAEAVDRLIEILEANKALLPNKNTGDTK